MNLLKKIYRLLVDPVVRMGYLDKIGFYKNMSDEQYIKLRFKRIFGYELDLNNVSTFNEKIQWLKLYDRKSIYTVMVDKYLAKNYVAEKIGNQYIIPNLGAWDNAEDIDFSLLPDKFVLKCNHNSGIGMCICSDKASINKGVVLKELKKGLKEDYFLRGREWPYKNVKRKIIAEQYLGDNINDYKLQCFNGKFDNILVCSDRNSQTGVKYYYFDKDWNYLPYSTQVDKNFTDYEQLKPKKFEEMIRLAEVLSEGIPELRVDFFEIDGKVYFGELTFFTQSGFDTTITREADAQMGEKVILPKSR